MPSRIISVLGSGWLGLPLAATLADAGHTVRASTTSTAGRERLAERGLLPHRIEVGGRVEGEQDGFFEADILIFTLPPSGSETPYPIVAEAVRRAAEAGGVGWMLMTSSTSVYPDLNRVVTERDAGSRASHPLRRRGADVHAAELVLQGSAALDATVLRLAGLYGYDRHPARSLAGRRDLRGGDAPTNLVHRDDVIRAVTAVLDCNARRDAFNVCADAHPTRQEVYPAVAKRLGLEPPTYAEGSAEAFKIVSNQRIRERLGFEFRYPDPMQPAP